MRRESKEGWEEEVRVCELLDWDNLQMCGRHVGTIGWRYSLTGRRGNDTLVYVGLGLGALYTGHIFISSFRTLHRIWRPG